MRNRILVFIAVLVLSAGCDHATKRVARDALQAGFPISVAADTVRFELAHNPGGFLNLGAGLGPNVRRLFFLLFVPVLLVVVCGAFLRSSPASRYWPLGLGLVTGGGLANWLDRLLHDGYVTDFVSMGLGPLRTGVFNVADVAVMTGALLLLLPLSRDGASGA